MLSRLGPTSWLEENYGAEIVEGEPFRLPVAKWLVGDAEINGCEAAYDQKEIIIIIIEH